MLNNVFMVLNCGFLCKFQVSFSLGNVWWFTNQTTTSIHSANIYSYGLSYNIIHLITILWKTFNWIYYWRKTFYQTIVFWPHIISIHLLSLILYMITKLRKKYPWTLQTIPFCNKKKVMLLCCHVRLQHK